MGLKMKAEQTWLEVDLSNDEDIFDHLAGVGDVADFSKGKYDECLSKDKEKKLTSSYLKNMSFIRVLK